MEPFADDRHHPIHPGRPAGHCRPGRPRRCDDRACIPEGRLMRYAASIALFIITFLLALQVALIAVAVP
jgi:hypothetical protein